MPRCCAANMQMAVQYCASMSGGMENCTPATVCVHNSFFGRWLQETGEARKWMHASRVSRGDGPSKPLTTILIINVRMKMMSGANS